MELRTRGIDPHAQTDFLRISIVCLGIEYVCNMYDRYMIHADV